MAILISKETLHTIREHIASIHMAADVLAMDNDDGGATDVIHRNTNAALALLDDLVQSVEAEAGDGGREL